MTKLSGKLAAKFILTLSALLTAGVAFAAESGSQSGSHSGSHSGPPGGGGARACDSYIQSLCSSSDDKGPGCLKGHESEVSSACLEDMQHVGQRPLQQAQ